MAHFVKISMEGGRSEYLNLDLVRNVEDNQDEGSVRVDFDSDHRVYLDREKAQGFLKAVLQTSE